MEPFLAVSHLTQRNVKNPAKVLFFAVRSTLVTLHDSQDFNRGALGPVPFRPVRPKARALVRPLAFQSFRENLVHWDEQQHQSILRVLQSTSQTLRPSSRSGSSPPAGPEKRPKNPPGVRKSRGWRCFDLDLRGFSSKQIQAKLFLTTRKQVAPQEEIGYLGFVQPPHTPAFGAHHDLLYLLCLRESGRSC